jgi:4-hydroxy-3-polyprenylbenzoate decarboxylase
LKASGPIVVGVTGASGAIYALRLVEALLSAGVEVLLCASETAHKIIATELPGAHDAASVFRFGAGAQPRVFSEHDLGAPFCSGSFRFAGMAIVPASMGTIGAIASGAGRNCIHRGAEVALKERRRLVVVPREAPLSPIHLENMLTLARAGAIVLPACPAFYGRAESVADLVDSVVARALDHLGVEHEIGTRWGEGGEPAP